LTNQPPPEHPSDPPPSTPDGTGSPISGQPWPTPTGDPLSAGSFPPPGPPPTPEAYQPPGPPAPGPPAPGPPAFKPGQASLPEPPPSPDYPPTSPFPAVPVDPPPVNYAPPGHAPDYGQPAGYPPPSGYGQIPPPDQQTAGPSYAQGPPGYGPNPAGYGPNPAGYGPPARKSNIPLIAVIVAVALLLCGGVATAGVLIARSAAEKAKEVVKPITQWPTSIPDLPTEAPGLPGLPTDLPTGLPTTGNGIGRDISVTYEVDGDGPAQILYLDKLGTAPERLDDVTLPWTFTATVQTPALVSVIAVRSGSDEGTISCRVLADGKEVKKVSSTNSFATAVCSWFVVD